MEMELVAINSKGFRLYTNGNTEVLQKHGDKYGLKFYLMEYPNGYKTYVVYNENGAPIYQSQNFEKVACFLDLFKINEKYEENISYFDCNQ